MRKLYVFIAMAAIWNTAVTAQQYTETFGARVQGGVLYSLHAAHFSSNGDITDCGQLSSGSGLNPIVQAIFEFPLSPSIAIGAGIGYAGRSGVLSRTNTYPIRDGQTGAESTLTTQMDVNATLSYLELQPDVRISLLGNNSKRTLGVVVGPRIALPLTTSFAQSERVVSPENAAFIADGVRTQTRSIATGPLTTRSSVLLGLSVGAEGLLPVSDKISIVPSISADYFLNSVVVDATWKVFAIRAEVGIRYSFGKRSTVDSPPPPPPPSETPVVTYAPVVLSITKPQFSGEIVTGSQLRATTPIVNAVFFDTLGHEIPLTYRRSDDGSIPPTDPVEAHSWVLVRIARAVKNNSNATVVLEGAGGAVGQENRGRQRAEAVQSALIAMGVPANRITVKSSDMPRVPSNVDFAGGREENHRVDILVNNAPLQEWVSSERFALLSGTLNTQVRRSGGDPAKRDNARIIAKVTGADSSTVTLNGSQGTIAVPIQQSLDVGADTVTLTLVAESDGVASESSQLIQLSALPRRSVELQTKDFEAVLRFDYNSAELTTDVKQLLSQLVEKLPAGSEIIITGSADVLGTVERNRQLSDQRARNTEAYIKSIAAGKVSTTSSTSSARFPDTSPQGRFLNRSIRVRAIAP